MYRLRNVHPEGCAEVVGPTWHSAFRSTRNLGNQATRYTVRPSVTYLHGLQFQNILHILLRDLG